MSIDRYRPIIALVLMLLLVATNTAYLAAHSGGPEAVQTYAAKWDTPQIKGVNLLLLAVLVLVAILKPKGVAEE